MEQRYFNGRDASRTRIEFDINKLKSWLFGSIKYNITKKLIILL